MYTYLWNFGVKHSENFESEVRTKFRENFENILGKLWGRFLISIRKFHESYILGKLWGRFSKSMRKFHE